MSERIGYAIVEVEPNEAATLEDFLALIDGDSVGHYGVKAELVATGDFSLSAIKKSKNGGTYIQHQFGFPRASMLKQERRYYSVMVSRD